MKSHTSIAALAASLAFAASPVLAQTEINFWHAMGGALVEHLEESAADGVPEIDLGLRKHGRGGKGQRRC